MGCAIIHVIQCQINKSLIFPFQNQNTVALCYFVICFVSEIRSKGFVNTVSVYYISHHWIDLLLYNYNVVLGLPPPPNTYMHDRPHLSDRDLVSL